MSATITIGWWVIPLAVTVLAFGWAQLKCISLKPSGSSVFPDMTPIAWLFYYGVAALVSLPAWLVWAVLT